jgi:cation diffusion facilitator family transporter
MTLGISGDHQDAGSQAVDSVVARRVLWTALALNATMFVIDVGAGLFARSSGLLADGVDMLSDAMVYGLSLIAMSRSRTFQHRTAFASGVLLAVSGIAVMLDAIRRALQGDVPEPHVMAGAAVLSLLVNATVLRMLARFRYGELHLRASWIFTRADVIANAGVIVAALLVAATASRTPDLIVGVAIGAYVVKEALEILKEASWARAM